MERCVACGKTNYRPHFPHLDIVKCQCGHIYYIGSLDNEKLKALYSQDYFHGDEYANYVADRPIIQKNFRSRLDQVLKYHRSGKLLEIGSAYGFFLDLAQKHFETKGFEISEDAAKYAKEEVGVDVQAGDFLSENHDPEKSYDVVCMYDCIEHLLEPDKFVQKIASLLKPGGHFFLTTGDIGALVPRLRGEKWRLVHPPTHIHYFNQQSMITLLERCGLQVLKFDYPGVWRSNCQTVSSVLKLKKPATFIPGHFYLNTFDIMEVVALKA